MAGNHRSGRKRKPLEHHLVAGTYRRDRHGPRPSELANGSAQTEPPAAGDTAIFTLARQDPLAEQLNEMLLPQLEPILAPTDSTAYAQLLAYWALWVKAEEAAQRDPTDRDARMAVIGYGREFDRLAAKFGLSPADRTALKFDFTEPEKSAFSKFLDRDRGIPKRDRSAEFERDESKARFFK